MGFGVNVVNIYINIMFLRYLGLLQMIRFHSLPIRDYVTIVLPLKE